MGIFRREEILDWMSWTRGDFWAVKVYKSMPALAVSSSPILLSSSHSCALSTLFSMKIFGDSDSVVRLMLVNPTRSSL